ncbi:MICAL-like protein 2 isoform X2 [Thalassophryne amazonica]|uniref:MICAL-like protein 2 isoform X2 n=1 Tax=Thalassophryne amazonica TaxID=390379 RepID=UPI001470A286|nr:MICAL-like protein 2 isoform X2 [Thalassophryne amazonica]
MAAIKALQKWCRVQCEGYRDVNITNMTTSFRDGMAFCALIHKHRPDLINFDSLKKENVYENNKLAFRVAEEELGIPALLDAEDMVALKVPDRLSILTYVSQYYNYFHGRSPIGGAGVKRPAQGPTDQPPGKKNQPAASKAFPSSKPASENRPPPSPRIAKPAASPKQSQREQQEVLEEKQVRTGTLSNKCVSCHQHVHLVQRHLVEGKLYHRNCAKSLSLTNTSAPLRDLPHNAPVSKYTILHPELINANTSAPAPAPSRLGPSWLTEKPGTAASAYKPASGFSSAGKDSLTAFVSKPTASQGTYNSVSTTTSSILPRPSAAPRTSTSAYKPASGFSSAGKDSPAALFSKPTASRTTCDSSVTTSITTTPSRPTAAPWTSSTTTSISKPASGFSSTEKESWTPFVSKPTAARTTGDLRVVTTTTSSRFTASIPTFSTTTPSRPIASRTAGDSGVTTTSSRFTASIPTFSMTTTTPSRPIASRTADDSSVTTTSSRFTTSVPTFSITTTTPSRPSAAPQTSTTAAKTLQSKLKFFQAGPEDTANEDSNKTATKTVEINRGWNRQSQSQEASVGQVVSVAVGVGGSDDVSSKPEHSDNSKTKAAAAAFICKKLAEENIGANSKPAWTTAVLKKTDKPTPAEPPKETGGGRGRVRLKVDPSILADLQTPPTTYSPNSSPALANQRKFGAQSPDRGSPKPDRASANTSENTESPADWRSRLKPVSKDTKPAASPKTSPLLSDRKLTDGDAKPAPHGAGKLHTSELPVAPSSGHHPSPSISVTPPEPKRFVNGQSGKTANGATPGSKINQTKPGYIPKEEILKELDQIEHNLNELEKRGIELEKKLRSSELEGEDDSVMDDLMVEWFTLIRNKQVAMRRESELVYIGRTQDLEEQQPSVEKALRRIMEKPEHLKTDWERKQEKHLMDKLVEIVNDRNAIVDGLDEDRLREEEEDEQLNKMMKNFNIKKDKARKKSQMSKLFSWGNKKEG